MKRHPLDLQRKAAWTLAKLVTTGLLDYDEALNGLSHAAFRVAPRMLPDSAVGYVADALDTALAYHLAAEARLTRPTSPVIPARSPWLVTACA